MKKIINVNLLNDKELEDPEMFTATLTTSDPNVDIPIDTATANILISDTDSMFNKYQCMCSLVTCNVQ